MSLIASRRSQTHALAVELFARRGFAQVGLRELASHLGITAGSIYYHIESKEGLLFELIEELYDDLLLIVSQHPRGRAKVSAELRLEEVIMAHLDLHQKKADYFKVAEHELHCLSEVHQQEILKLRERYETQLYRVLGPLEGGHGEQVTRSAVHGLVSLLNNLPLWLNRTQLEPLSLRVVIGNMAMGAVKGALGVPALR